jgi:hypothetical protein
VEVLLDNKILLSLRPKLKKKINNMHIANPIYDVVFKFMMEDEKVAKSFISAIIEEEVVELDFSAQEYTIHKIFDAPDKVRKKVRKKEEEEEEKLFLTVCRVDFSAKIALRDGGFKSILIELQKAKLSSDIMRFRRYLGLHYQNPNNAYVAGDDKKARQIYCIFLLGYDIGYPDHPVLQVDFVVKDGTTKEYVSNGRDNEFVQTLHHLSWIVQINQLKQRRRNDIEKLLSIFDQDNRTEDHHIMNVKEEDFPEIYRPIIRRLRMASEDEKIKREMEVEDDYWNELQKKERKIADQNKALEEKDKALEESKKTIEEKDKALEAKDKELEELKKQLEILKAI